MLFFDSSTHTWFEIHSIVYRACLLFSYSANNKQQNYVPRWLTIINDCFFLFGCILEIERLKTQKNLFYSSQLWMSMFFCLISIYILQSKDSNLLAQYVYIFIDSVYLHFSTRSKPFWIENLSLILTTKMKTTWKFIDFHTQISIHTSGQDEKGIFIYLHARLFNWYNSFGAFTL